MANVSQNVASELWQVSKIEGFEFLSSLTLTVFDKLPSPLPIELLTKGLNCAALLIYIYICHGDGCLQNLRQVLKPKFPESYKIELELSF